MILQSLEVEHWRCFLRPVRIEDLSPGMNVIFGPNGSGKSTLFEALRRALLDRHDTKGTGPEQWKPWGRDLAPRVSVEFSHGGVTYRLDKQFLKSPASRLHRLEGGRFEPYLSGREADDHVRGLFSHSRPGKGLSKAEHWGLFQVLWAPQGELALWPAPELLGHLRAALNQAAEPPSLGPIGAEIHRRFRQFFSETGKPTSKKGSLGARLKRLEREERELEQRVQELETRLQTLDELRAALSRDEAERRLVQRQLQALATRREDLAIRAKRYADLAKERAELEKQADRAVRWYEDLVRRLESIAKTKERIQAATERAARLTEELQAAEKELRTATERAGQARRAYEALRRETGKLEALERRARLARRLVGLQEKVRLLSDRARRATEVAERIEALRGMRAELVSPDRHILEDIEALIQKEQVLEAQREASLLHLEVELLQPADLAPVTGEVVQREPEFLRVRGGGLLEVRLADLARIRAWGPTQDLEDLDRVLKDTAQRIEDATRPYGTRDLGELRRLVQEAERLEREAEREAERLAELCRDHGTLEDLLSALRQSEAERDAILAEFPEWSGETPDPSALEERVTSARRQHEDVLEEHRRILQEAETRRERAEAEVGRLRDLLEAQERERRGLSQSIEELLAGAEPRDLEQERARAALEADAARAKLEELGRELEALGPDPGQELQRVEQELAGLEAKERKLRDRTHELTGRIRGLAEQGLATDLGETSERLEAVRSELSGLRRRREAIALLHQVHQELLDQRARRLLDPVARLAGNFLHCMAGPAFRKVTLEEDLSVAGVVPRAVEETIEVDNLSGGEQEQLHLAVRLALAHFLAQEERQLLVLDDVLMATDLGRLANIVELLQQLAKDRLQVILLTCHEDRYAGLPDTRYIDLQALRDQ